MALIGLLGCDEDAQRCGCGIGQGYKWHDEPYSTRDERAEGDADLRDREGAGVDATVVQVHPRSRQDGRVEGLEIELHTRPGVDGSDDRESPEPGRGPGFRTLVISVAFSDVGPGVHDLGQIGATASFCPAGGSAPCFDMLTESLAGTLEVTDTHEEQDSRTQSKVDTRTIRLVVPARPGSAVSMTLRHTVTTSSSEGSCY